MPSKSKKQHKFMAAVANNPEFAKETGVPQSVGREFMKADRGRSFSGGGMADDKLKMVTNDEGQRVPFYAADGKGKMAAGGKVKKMRTGGMAKCPRDGIAQRGRTRA
jgi:hypothetical protein